MGGDRNAEKETKDSTVSSGLTTKVEEYRQYCEIFKPCAANKLYLPGLSLIETDQPGTRSYVTKGGTVSFDEIGNTRIYDSFNEVFHYGPNEKESFVWINGKSGGTLSEIKLSNNETIKFNPMSQNWQVIDDQGRIKGEQRFHNAAFTVNGMIITVPLEGTITPERLQSEYKKLKNSFESGEKQGLIPFNSDEFTDVQNHLKAKEEFVPGAYVDTKGILTVGYGFNLEQNGAKRMLASVGANYDAIVNSRLTANPIELTRPQAEALLRNTTVRSVYECRNAYPGYDQYSANVKRVLLDLMFNMEPETLSKFERFNSHIKAGRLKEAAKALLDSDYAKQVGSRALENAEELKNSKNVKN